jgi:hypothetical protein
MGGPCKDKPIHATPGDPVGPHALPRHRGPSLEDGNLTARIVAYNKLHDKAPYHKPGSTNRHKS